MEWSYTKLSECANLWTWMYYEWPVILGGQRGYRFFGITYDRAEPTDSKEVKP